MRKYFTFPVLVMGASGIVAQIILLRELLVVFSGNELSIGIMLSNWLILEAAGALLLGRFIEKIKRKIEAFVIVTFLFSISFPLAVYFIRILKWGLSVSIGEGLGLWPILYLSFLVFLPVSFLHGALFTFCCKIYSWRNQSGKESDKKGAESIGKVYIWETVGSIIGGVALTYLLIPYFNSLRIASGISLLNFIVGFFIVGAFWRSGQTAAKRILGALSVSLVVFCAYFIFSGKADILHRFSIGKQWPGQEVVYYKNSIYGNVAVAKRGQQYSFFSDGIPIITTPTPDIAFIEEFAHLPMLSHANPKEILILSGGAGGVIGEVLKHPSVNRVDYAELDPLLLETVENFPTALTEMELSDPRVNIKYLDGRLFAERTSNKYDLVLVGLSNPQDLQVNRLFTKEFFSLISGRLKEGGIFVFSLPGSLTYLGEELKNLNSCILNTSRSVYPHVKIIPGDGVNLFLASTSEEILNVSVGQLIHRFEERGIEAGLLTAGYIEYKLDSRRLSWFLRSLEGATQRINQDFKPLGVFYSLSYWNSLFSPYLRNLFRNLEKVNLPFFAILFSVLTLILLGLSFAKNKILSSAVPLSIATTGAAGMIFDLAIIFTFQSIYGYVYSQIGLLIAVFMVGVVIGGWKSTASLSRIKNHLSLFLKLEAAIIVFSAILPFIFIGLSLHLGQPIIYVILRVVFLLISFIAGALVGAEFPLANHIHLRSSANLSSSAGLLYAADLFGGWIAGIVGGVVLLPILGLVETCIVVVIFKAGSFIVLFVFSRNKRQVV